MKRYEAELALQAGAQELDMVINTCALKSGEFDVVEREIAGVVEVANRYGAPVKAIIETFVLADEEKVAAAKIAERAGAAFVKTSSGMVGGGATVEDVRLLRATLSPKVVVKASGGITDIDKLLALYDAGARHFGLSYTADILEGFKSKLTAGV